VSRLSRLSIVALFISLGASSFAQAPPPVRRPTPPPPIQPKPEELDQVQTKTVALEKLPAAGLADRVKKTRSPGQYLRGSVGRLIDELRRRCLNDNQYLVFGKGRLL